MARIFSARAHHGEMDRGEEGGEHVSGFERERQQEQAGQSTAIG